MPTVDWSARGPRDAKVAKPTSLVSGHTGRAVGCLQRAHPADDGGELLGPGHFRSNPPDLRWHRLVPGDAAKHAATKCAAAPVSVFRAGAADRAATGRRDCPDHAAQERMGTFRDVGYRRAAASDSLECYWHDLGDLSTAGCWTTRTFH